MDAIALLTAVLSYTLAQPGPDAPVRAITKPNKDVTISFLQPGIVAELSCREGQTVKAGQILARLDDSLEQAQYELIKAQSQDTTQIKASQASLEQKKVDLKRLETAAIRNAATDLEVEHARLDVLIAQLSLELAEFEHRQAGLKLKEAQVRLDRMRVESPIDGTVEEVLVEPGEAVNALDKVIRIVSVDPLWIEASVPLTQAVQLRPGEMVTVEFPQPRPALATGQVLSIAQLADAASQTIRVRIEVPNPAGRPAGEHVRVHCGARGGLGQADK